MAKAFDFLIEHSSLVNFFVFGFEVSGFVGFPDNYVTMFTVDVGVVLCHWNSDL
jgi:hypothetical protein